MWRYILQRLFLFIPTFIGVTLISFMIIHLAPGDPAELRAGGGLGAGMEAGISLEKRGTVDQALAEWRAQFGLDRPYHVQYGLWLKNLFTLNFGDSFKDNQPVIGKILERLPVTIKLNIFSILLVYLVAIPLGVYSATHSYSFGDQVTTFAAFVLFALPGLPALELIRTAPHRVSVIILVKIIGEAPHVVRQLRVPTAELTDGHIFKKIVRIIEMARQDINATEHILIKKIGLLGDKADRIVINQLCIHHGGIINPDEGSINQGTFDVLPPHFYDHALG